MNKILCILAGFVLLISITVSGPCPNGDADCKTEEGWFCNDRNVCDKCDAEGNCMADSKGPSNSRSSDRSSSSNGGSSSRKSGSRGGSSGGRSGSSSSKRGGSRDSDSNEGMGCCVGTKAMCSNSMNMNNCDNMMEDHGCHWTTGHECMMENNHAEVMMFGEDSAVKEAMNTQVNLSSVLLLAVAALAMHCLSKCWENRKNFEGYTPTQPDQQNSNYQAVASV